MFDDEYNEIVFFSGTCTCEHEGYEHGWGECDVIDDETITKCPCEAGWEE